MAETHSFEIAGATITFHVYLDQPDTASKIEELRPYFARMPDTHLRLLWPIFVVDHKPGGGPGGGTWAPDEVRSMFMGEAHSRRTGVPDADVETLVLANRSGMMAIPRDRWMRRINRLRTTVMHEVAHCVDFQLGLVPRGADAEDFPGMGTDRCGAGGHMSRRAVEAYARALYQPWRIYHSREPSQSAHDLNQRNLETVRRAPAFTGVSGSWPL